MDVFTRKLVIRYIVVYVAATILVSVVGYFLRKYTSAGTSGGLGIVPILVASMEAGQYYYRQKSTLPPRPYAWKMAAIFTAVSVVISLILAAVVLPAGQFSAGGTGMMLGFVLGITVVYLVAAWFFFGFGAKNMKKAQSR